jgi:hypothetical protein
MKSMIMVAAMAAVTFAFVGCKKEETPGSKLDSALNSAKAQAGAAQTDAEKSAGDLQKKLDGALKK